MPEMTGLEFQKNLTNPPAIIFTTAHREFALDAYELAAIDYLLKPIAFDRFFKSISRYYLWRGDKQIHSTGNTDAQKEDQFIYIKSDRKMIKLFLRDILMIESLKDYVKIHLSDDTIVTKEKISALESNLPSNQFIRVHRSFLIPINKIKAFTAELIEIPGHEIPIGRTYKSSVMSLLGIQE